MRLGSHSIDSYPLHIRSVIFSDCIGFPSPLLFN
ncbi:hypothetical protein LINPERPRIM_LOCUS40233 [Linum perenne]